jgi:hypothetical protein
VSRFCHLFAAGSLILAAGIAASAQRRDAFIASRDEPAIRYSTGPTTDPVAALNEKLQSGAVSLAFEPSAGYLRSVLDAFNIPVESQALVFSQSSFQAPLINVLNPRSIYFGDTVAVGWVRGGRILEITAQDPNQGVIFYELDQKESASPRFVRNNDCLACHLSWETRGVPGLLVQSMYPIPDEISYANGFTTVHGSPLEQRWGGWFVTGDTGGAKHMGNVTVMPADKGKLKLASPTSPLNSVVGLIDLTGYPTPYSDVVAQMVLAHQTQMTNLITRAGWESRMLSAKPSTDASARLAEAVTDLVDYLLFVDEAPLTGPVKGTAGFTERFAKSGPRDKQGRSLRDFDLKRRLFQYPCSYMIYTPAFDALPQLARDAVYNRMWDVLSGREKQPRYKVLSPADRRAIVEILRETKPGLPEYFAAVQ